MNFDLLNETDVREEIVAPWLRALGYRTGTQHNVRRELYLQYDRLSLGRKKGERDPELRGKADYVLEAGGRVRWVLEAKAPSNDLGPDEVEQAWTYANHPEVRAVYHCLCNGRRLDMYRTNSGPSHPALLSLLYAELTQPAGWSRLERLLAPEAVLRDNPDTVVDTDEPVGPGLRSFAQIVGGHIRYHSSSLRLPALTQIQISAIGGTVQRNEGGGLVATVQTRAPTFDLQALLERMRLTSFSMRSNDHTISADQNRPSLFTYEGQVVFPEGQSMPDINTWESRRLLAPMGVRVRFAAQVSVQFGRLVGTVRNEATFNDVTSVVSEGSIELWLS